MAVSKMAARERGELGGDDDDALPLLARRRAGSATNGPGDDVGDARLGPPVGKSGDSGRCNGTSASSLSAAERAAPAGLPSDDCGNANGGTAAADKRALAEAQVVLAVGAVMPSPAREAD